MPVTTAAVALPDRGERNCRETGVAATWTPVRLRIIGKNHTKRKSEKAVAAVAINRRRRVLVRSNRNNNRRKTYSNSNSKIRSPSPFYDSPKIAPPREAARAVATPVALPVTTTIPAPVVWVVCCEKPSHCETWDLQHRTTTPWLPLRVIPARRPQKANPRAAKGIPAAEAAANNGVLGAHPNNVKVMMTTTTTITTMV